MGGKNLEFEVERRREDRVPLTKDEASSSNATNDETDPAPEGSWQAYFENARTVENMKFFIMAQSFVMFLTFGLPQMQKLSRHMYTVLEEEVNKNPFMKKDLEDYKAQLAEQERQKDQMKELEEQAKKIQEQLEMLSKKQMPVRPRKYVQMEGDEVITEAHRESNQSEESRIEL